MDEGISKTAIDELGLNRGNWSMDSLEQLLAVDNPRAERLSLDEFISSFDEEEGDEPSPPTDGPHRRF